MAVTHETATPFREYEQHSDFPHRHLEESHERGTRS